jgi:hypothetical protein
MRGIRGEFTEPLGVLFRPVLTPERTNCTRHNNPSYVCMQAQHLPLHSLQRPDSRSKYFFRQMTLRKSVGPRPLVETRKSPHRGDHLEIYQRAKMPRPRCLLSPASFPLKHDYIFRFQDVVWIPLCDVRNTGILRFKCTGKRQGETTCVLPRGGFDDGCAISWWWRYANHLSTSSTSLLPSNSIQN